MGFLLDDEEAEMTWHSGEGDGDLLDAKQGLQAQGEVASLGVGRAAKDLGNDFSP